MVRRPRPCQFQYVEAIGACFDIAVERPRRDRHQPVVIEAAQIDRMLTRGAVIVTASLIKIL